MPILTALPESVCEAVAEHLWLGDLLPFATTNRDLHWVSTKVADAFFKSAFAGMAPCRQIRFGRRTMPDWLTTFATLQPRCLVCGYCSRWRSQTCALPFELNSVGPWFVEFKYVATKAPNGTPGIGVVDAASLAKTTARDDGVKLVSQDLCCRWLGDLSQLSDGHFAMSLSPYDGTLFAKRCQEETCNCAQLNWVPIRDQQSKWNRPLHCGFLLKNRCLTFFRMDNEGCWHSGEIVCKNLPDFVSPCMFMSSYVGYSLIRFERLWNSPPDLCPHCDAAFHGFAKPFRSWP